MIDELDTDIFNFFEILRHPFKLEDQQKLTLHPFIITAIGWRR